VDQTYSMGIATGTESAAAPVVAGIPASARLLLRLFSRLRVGTLTVLTPSGARLHFGSAQGTPAAELRILDWRACASILRGGDIGFADALRRGWVDSPGLTALVRLAIVNEGSLKGAVRGVWLARLWFRLRHGLRRNTRAGSRENIHAHYDIGNAFYALWLDAGLTYSSALFRGNFSLDLAQAQADKYQRVIDVLQLKPGMRVLEIGCGWGGFALHAARLGIHVHGITISEAQLQVARERVAQEGLEERIALDLRDYRDLTGQYEAIVSIEMFEAVGQPYWQRWFATLRKLLVPGGRALVQTITIDEARFERYAASSDFIRHYIFPGGMLPSVKRFVAGATGAGLVTRDLLAFGKDYAETMRRWHLAFTAVEGDVRAQGFDEVFLRTWRLYLAYCEAGFDEGRIDVVQFLLERRDA